MKSRAHRYRYVRHVAMSCFPDGRASVAPPTLSYASPQSWYDYFTVVNLAPTTTGATSFAVQSGSLPTGVSLNTSTGAITGTPTALKAAGDVVIRATGPGGTVDATINVEVLWFPSSITGIFAGYDPNLSSLWQDSARTTPATANSDPLGAVDDLSGNGRHLIQATSGDRPLLLTNAINSLAAIDLNGTDHYLSLTGGLSLTNLTIVAVLKFDSLAPTISPVMFAKNGLYVSGDANMYVGLNGTTQVAPYAASDIGTTDYRVHTATVEDLGGTDRRGTIYLDDTQKATADFSANGIDDGIWLGRANYADTALLDGKCAALVLFNANVSAGDLDNLWNYYAARYGLVFP